MRLSAVRSSVAGVFVTLLALSSPALATSPPASSLRIYGAYLPDRLQWDDARWGFGFATRAAFNTRWSLEFGAARFAGSGGSVTPVTVGLVYGPESRRGIRPWVDAGMGYYRLGSAGVRIAPTQGFDYVTQPKQTLHWYDVGGYFGLGVDVPLSGRLGLGTGVRIHGWSDPDALIALQSGLSYGF